MDKKFSVKRMAMIAVFAAVICILAPLSVPIGEVPLSLSVFAVLLAAMALSPLDALFAVLVYILLGGIGLPVFAGFKGGFQVLAGPTGGYIVGYLPCAFITALIFKPFKKKKLFISVLGALLGAVLGVAVCYAFGTVWFMISTKRALVESLMICVVQFIPADLIKIAIATPVAMAINKAIATIERTSGNAQSDNAESAESIEVSAESENNTENN